MDYPQSLPSPEEAKINASLSGVFSAQDIEGVPEREEQVQEHDQLPSVDEAKLYCASSQSSEQQRENIGGSGSNKVKLCLFGIALTVVLVVTILVAVLTQPEDDFPVERAWESTPAPTEGYGPIVVPETKEYNDLVEFLVGKGVSDRKDLEDPGSAQQRAASWLTTKDSQHHPWTERSVESLVQRYVLVVFYYAMGGPNWPSDLRFLSDSSECTWKMAGFTALQRAIQYEGVECTESGKVVSIRMPADFLSGSFPLELSFLSNLEEFFVYKNPNVADEFPIFLKGMKNLKLLGLHYCKILDKLPQWLSDMTSLETLILSNNYLQGSIENINWSKLVNLEALYLDDNNLEGDIGALAKMNNPVRIVLEDNKFSGRLRESFFEGWDRLEVFDASHNSVSGSIPASVFSIKKLRVLDLHVNDLEGRFPAFEVFKDDLEVLSIRDNRISGEIPRGLYQFDRLQQLDLSNNLFSGTIPMILQKLSPTLEFLFVSNNPLEATEIPTFFQQMTNLKDLSLKGTNLFGSIPEWIGTLSNLVLLDLDSNDLAGSIPNSIGQLSLLEYLLLNRNELTGTLPESMELLTNLGAYSSDFLFASCCIFLQVQISYHLPLHDSPLYDGQE